MKLRIGELVAGDARADGGAAQPELLHTVHELLHREIGKLQRNRREGHEAIRVFSAELGEPVVLHADHLGHDIALRSIPPRVDAERLHVDALAIHLADAPRPDLLDPRSAVVFHLEPEQRVRFRNHAMRVHVDRRHATTADHHFTAPAGRHRFAALSGRPHLRFSARGRPRLGSSSRP